MRLPSPATSLRAAALCLTAALGCGGDPLGPHDVAGTYVLQRVAGDALPAVVSENEYVVSRALADTVRLDRAGGGTASGVQEYRNRGDVAWTGPLSHTSELRYQVVGGRIEIEYVCGPLALCAAPPHLVARRTADGLRVDAALGRRVPQLYGRVPAGG